MTRPLRIAAADDESTMRDYMRDLLPRLGHQVLVAENGRQLVELCHVSAPDLIIVDIRLPDMDGLEAAAEITRERPAPVLVVSAYHEPELRARALTEHVMGYLVKPVKQADLETAIELAVARFEHCQSLRREAADLRQSLEDRKLIERAKGVVMRRTGASEEEAFRRLRKLSSNQNRRLVEVARMVMAAEEVFAELDGDASVGRPPADHYAGRPGARRPSFRVAAEPASGDARAASDAE